MMNDGGPPREDFRSSRSRSPPPRRRSSSPPARRQSQSPPTPPSRDRRRGRSPSYSPPRRSRRSRSRSPPPRGGGRRDDYNRSYHDRGPGRFDGPRDGHRGRGGPYHRDDRFRDDRGYRGPPGVPFDDPPQHRGPPPDVRRDRRRRSEAPPGVSLLVRNISHDMQPEDLHHAFGRIGVIRDVYIPRDYHSQQPKGFAFIEYATPEMASEAKYEMDKFTIRGRQIEVVFAQERRKTPKEMRTRMNDIRGGPGDGVRRDRGPPDAQDGGGYDRRQERDRTTEHRDNEGGSR